MRLTLRELLKHTAAYAFLLLVMIAVAIEKDATLEQAMIFCAPALFFALDVVLYNKLPVRWIASAILTYFSLPLGYTPIALNVAYFLLSSLHETDINSRQPS